MSKIKDYSEQGIRGLVQKIILVLVAGFFLYFGIEILLGAFTLKEPFTFILTFFASNFIILISGALMIGFLFEIHGFYHHRQMEDQQQEPEDKK